MKIALIVGARPQFIKLAPLYFAIRQEGLTPIIIHTGQHYSPAMNELFFHQLGLPDPDHNLNIQGGSHSQMVGRMLKTLEPALTTTAPDWVVVFGDTNSTLAGALAAKQAGLRLAHVEAGLRAGRTDMPEELNRVVADRVSDLLFCPTLKAAMHLKQEGLEGKARIVGDIMLDAFRIFSAQKSAPVFPLPERFILATVHREENTLREKLEGIVEGLNRLHQQECPVVLPAHPRIRRAISRFGLKPIFALEEPVGYLQMLFLLNRCQMVATDSGGLQKEAFFAEKPCIVLRPETEWEELVEAAAALIVGSSAERIFSSYHAAKDRKVPSIPLFGNGYAAEKIIHFLRENTPE
ncbi:MAG: UDP-N-acetylglucosamine 2-epimerase (non-hydrolyzing) [Phaeodactylibacter sp.]|nr:UDP-N-acetylglucosamine 2-epimerase (non-hydrolyzing) [Phaeodactylibacter sp.]